MPAAEFTANVLLSVLFISSFIAIFFFTYASRIEKEIVIKQTEKLVDDLTGGAGVFLKDSGAVKEFVRNLQVDDLSEQDRRTYQQNRSLLGRAALVMGVFAATLFVVFIAVVYFFKLGFRRLLLMNLIGLVAVAIVEFSFLTFIAKNYISFDPNYVRGAVVSALQEFHERSS